MRMAYTSESPEGIACVEENVDSHSIVVEGSAPRHARPSKWPHRISTDMQSMLTYQGTRERAILQILKNDGQNIPSPPS
jgi:hypothetical protein